MLRIYIGLFYVAGDDNPIIRYLHGPFGTASLLPSLVFLVRCLQRVAIELLLRALKTSPRLFKILTCGRIDADKFLKEHNPSSEFDAEGALELQKRAKKKPGQPDEKSLAALDIDEPAEGDIDLGREKLQ